MQYDGKWMLESDNPLLGIRVYRLETEDHIVRRKEYYRADALASHNAEARAANAGTRWGDGQVVASIPLNVLFNPQSGLFEAMRTGDDKYVNRWLNDSDNAKFRTREGKL